MEYKELQKFTGKRSISLSRAMQAIDANTCGILFLTDEAGKLCGCVTDGDIRRFLLSGGQMSDPAERAANPHPRIARTLEDAKALYHKKNYVAIPVVDEDGIVTDIYMGDGSVPQKHGSLHVPVVINAGGKGTRLEPFTKVLPKPLIPVGDHPIIELIMQEYMKYDCSRFHIIVNYKRELMKAYFADMADRYDITWYDEDKPLGTGGGLSLLKGKLDSTFFFANCDALLTADYEKMLQFHREQGNVITMICAYKHLSIPYGIVEMGINGKIETMKEKPVMSFLTNTGIYIVEPEVIDDMEDDVSIGFPDVVERERVKGRKVAAYPVSENDWMDMGQLSELEKMRARLFGE